MVMIPPDDDVAALDGDVAPSIDDVFGAEESHPLGPVAGGFESLAPVPDPEPETDASEDDADESTDESEGDESEGDAEGDPEELADTSDSEFDLGDGTTLPVDEVRSRLAQYEQEAPLREQGRAFTEILQTFWRDENGAREILAAFHKNAEGAYGLTPDDFLPEGGVSDDGLRLQYQASQRANTDLRKQIATMRSEFQSVLEEIRPEIDNIKAEEVAEAGRKEIRRLSGKDLSAKEIRRMMNETGSDDPVKAYKLATYDNRAAKASPKSPPMPKTGSSGKTFDPQDPNLTTDRMIALMEDGWVPKGAASAAAGKQHVQP